MVGEKTGLQFIDREIIEYIAGNAELRQSTVENFDERHPGVMSNIGALAFGEILLDG
nr:hypothetical protein [Desulfopila inferna]